MADWTRGMQQTYQFWLVDPGTWQDYQQLETVTSCSVTRDSTTDKIESAKLTLDEDIGSEAYVRAYLVAVQDGARERVCLGTWLVQTPEADYDGKVITRTADAYGPLQELDDDMPMVGYSVAAGSDIMGAAYDVLDQHCRAPVSEPNGGKKLTEAFVANDGDSWLKFDKDLAAKGGAHIEQDAYGRLSLAPDSDPSSLTPVWDYDDGNSSILEAEVTDTADWYKIPNTVEVVVSKDDKSITGTAENSDPNSPLSIASRGRIVKKRVTDAQLGDAPSQATVDAYARKVLLDESQLERKVTYSHAWNGVKLGDGVSLRYERHGLRIDRAKVVAQEFECATGLTVKETAVYMESMWDGD